MNNLEKIKNIEFLRVIGCIAVVLYHTFFSGGLHSMFPYIWKYNELWIMTSNGQKAVDLFFILSDISP